MRIKSDPKLAPASSLSATQKLHRAHGPEPIMPACLASHRANLLIRRGERSHPGGACITPHIPAHGVGRPISADLVGYLFFVLFSFFVLFPFSLFLFSFLCFLFQFIFCFSFATF
jgi:hypothetical protein